MSKEEQFKKSETVSEEKPGVNGNFDSLIPGLEESNRAKEKCIGAYKALMRSYGYTEEEKEVEEDGGRQQQEEEK